MRGLGLQLIALLIVRIGARAIPLPLVDRAEFEVYGDPKEKVVRRGRNGFEAGNGLVDPSLCPPAFCIPTVLVLMVGDQT